MKGIKKIIAIALMAAMTISFAACGEPTEEKNDDKTSTSQTAQISDGNSETPESSVPEDIELSNPQSEAESSNPESEISSNTSSNQNTNSDGTQTSKPAEASQTSKPQTSNQNTNSNGTQTSKPADTSQTSNTTSNQNTNSNGTQFSKPADTSQTSKPQTSKPVETPQVSKPVTKPSVQSISLNKTSLTLTVGQTAKLSYSISPSNAEAGKITWTWSDSKVVSVSGDGTVTAKAAGKATVTIKTSNGKSASCNVTVKAKQTSTSDNTTSSQPSKPMTKEEKIAAAYQAPYEGKITGWQETVIADLREVGEKKYNMTWEDSFYVRKRGTEYNCGFNFPESTFDRSDGKRFREDCLWQFELLKSQCEQWGEPIDDGYTRFKIVIEDLGVDKYRGEHEFFVYLCYG